MEATSSRAAPMTGGVASHGRAAYDPRSWFYPDYCRAVLADLTPEQWKALEEIATDPARSDLHSEKMNDPGLGDLVRCVSCLGERPTRRHRRRRATK